MNKAKKIGYIMFWGGIAAMVLTFASIDLLHLSFEFTSITCFLFFIVVGLGHLYLYMKVDEVKENYLIVCTGLNCHIKQKILFNDIESIDVEYGYYNADIIINIKDSDVSKHGEIIKYKLVDWESIFGLQYPLTKLPGNKVDEWLFPILDVLYTKCSLSVDQKKTLFDIAVTDPLKKWHPPGEQSQTDQNPEIKKRKILAYVILGIVIGLIITFVIFSIINSI